MIQDGPSLLAGALKSLSTSGSTRPRVLAATHFHEIFEAGFLLKETGIAYGHMEVKIDLGAEEAENQLTYLYKYDRDKSRPINSLIER